MKKSPASLTRRDALKSAALTAGALTLASTTTRSHAAPGEKPTFLYCLNTSTIRGNDLTIEEEIDITAKAGYDGIEPWTRKIGAYVEAGGKLADLRKRLEDHNLTVESAIGFARWIVDDDKVRAEGIEEIKRDMDALSQLGAKRIAAPPAGANKDPGLDLNAAAERYRHILELGEQFDVTPQAEIWGPSANLSHLSEALYVAARAEHPNACVLTDVYHIYKGGGGYEPLGLLSPQAHQVLHMNDYPADPPLADIKDGDRVFPGDGVAPLTDILQLVASTGARPVLSLELFNKTYWENPPAETAKTGLQKMQSAVTKAFA